MIQPTNLQLPNFLIKELQRPIGHFFKSESGKKSPEQQVVEYCTKNPPSMLVVVGDYVSKSLLEANFVPDVILIDYFTQRTKKADFTLPAKHRLIESENPPGQISKSAWLVIRNELFHKNNSVNEPITVIAINGEEDLLVLPVILEIPISSPPSYVLYGQPPMIDDGSSGIVLIEVTESIKVKIASLLEKFVQV